MVDIQQNFFFGVEVHQLILFQDFLFAHDFEGIDVVLASELDQFDSSEGAVAEGGEYF